MNNTHKPLTMHDLVALETVARAAQTNAKVRWLSANLGEILEGTARSIGDERGMFLAGDDDVRDGYLRITSTGGFDYFLPVAKLVELVHEGGFAIDS
jgi:hypothetical protein